MGRDRGGSVSTDSVSNQNSQTILSSSSLTTTTTKDNNGRRNSLESSSKKTNGVAVVKTTGPIHNQRYKMKLCQNYEAEGKCPYNEKCQFAHGQPELDKWTRRKRAQQQQQQQQQNIEHGSIRRGSIASSESIHSTILSPNDSIHHHHQQQQQQQQQHHHQQLQGHLSSSSSSSSNSSIGMNVNPIDDQKNSNVNPWKAYGSPFHQASNSKKFFNGNEQTSISLPPSSSTLASTTTTTTTTTTTLGLNPSEKRQSNLLLSGDEDLDMNVLMPLWETQLSSINDIPLKMNSSSTIDNDSLPFSYATNNVMKFAPTSKNDFESTMPRLSTHSNQSQYYGGRDNESNDSFSPIFSPTITGSPWSYGKGNNNSNSNSNNNNNPLGNNNNNNNPSHMNGHDNWDDALYFLPPLNNTSSFFLGPSANYDQKIINGSKKSDLTSSMTMSLSGPTTF